MSTYDLWLILNMEPKISSIVILLFSSSSSQILDNCTNAPDRWRSDESIWLDVCSKALMSRRIFPHKWSPLWVSLGVSLAPCVPGPRPGPRLNLIDKLHVYCLHRLWATEIISENFQQHLVSHKLEQNSICPRISAMQPDPLWQCVKYRRLVLMN